MSTVSFRLMDNNHTEKARTSLDLTPEQAEALRGLMEGIRDGLYFQENASFCIEGLAGSGVELTVADFRQMS
ncbi:MAG: hypothetical protein ACLFOY_03245 [Desulfatibacillaceae bacterium]